MNKIANLIIIILCDAGNFYSCHTLLMVLVAKSNDLYTVSTFIGKIYFYFSDGDGVCTHESSHVTVRIGSQDATVDNVGAMLDTTQCLELKGSETTPISSARELHPAVFYSHRNSSKSAPTKDRKLLCLLMALSGSYCMFPKTCQYKFISAYRSWLFFRSAN